MKRFISCMLCIVMCASALVSCRWNKGSNVCKEPDIVYFDDIGYVEHQDGYVLTDLSRYASWKLIVPNELADGKKVYAIRCDDFSKIDELYMGDNVTVVSLDNCEIKKLHIGASYTNGYFSVFKKDIIEELSVSENNPRYYSKGNCLIERDTHTVIYGCKNSVIPESALAVGNSAFSALTFESFEIPKSVSKIGVSAFAHCKSLRSIYIPITVTEIGSSAFYGTPDLVINCEANTKPENWDDDWCETEKIIQLGAAKINWGVKHKTEES